MGRSGPSWWARWTRTGYAAARERLSFFVQSGHLPALPTRWQLAMGWAVMLPVTLSESDRERELSRRTWMGQVPVRVPVQLLFNPRQALVETGLEADASYLVDHLLCVFHEDAFLGYDLQLLQTHPGGLALLEREARRVVEGRHRWARVLRSVVGGAGYHERLMDWAPRAARFEYPDPLDVDPRFATLLGFAGFCLTLPTWPEAEFYGFDPRPQPSSTGVARSSLDADHMVSISGADTSEGS